ncbi:hypothetical protein [Roseibium sp.]|uniref:hypothetical protein n=1 Tax=Roseibium sp. TaxID=1936156 RepID=UPI003A969B1E
MSRRCALYAFATLLAGTLLVCAGSDVAQADDSLDRLQRSQEIRDNEAAGGPRVKGANSPFMLRVKVCKDLPTEIRDRKTGEVRVEMRERCWFE